ncbi:MAG: DUF1223 domain-containing protein [Kiloniellales bacterium]|jgi:hypothetical protein
MHRALQWAAAAILAVTAAVFTGTGGTALSPAPAFADTSTPVVVELFTSQGCNTCPPAESFLRELAGEDGIIALELHIDYWDYIGWKDPFASPEMTARQRGYAQELRLPYVYTPQMVIDGRFDVVGSHRNSARGIIRQAAERGKPIDVHLSDENGGTIIIPAGHSPDGGATVWLAIYDDQHETEVLRGENAGQNLLNRNVVRELESLGTWTGERMEIPVDLARAAARGRAGCVVLLQQGRTGPILGAAATTLGTP